MCRVGSRVFGKGAITVEKFAFTCNLHFFFCQFFYLNGQNKERDRRHSFIATDILSVKKGPIRLTFSSFYFPKIMFENWGCSLYTSLYCILLELQCRGRERERLPGDCNQDSQERIEREARTKRG